MSFRPTIICFFFMYTDYSNAFVKVYLGQPQSSWS